MCGPRSVLLVLGASALALAVTFLITAIPLKSWYTYTYKLQLNSYDESLEQAGIGLWKYCRNEHDCDPLEFGTVRCPDGSTRPVAARWNAVEGLAIASPVCAFLGLLLLPLNKLQTRWGGVPSIAFSLLAWALSLSAVIVAARFFAGGWWVCDRSVGTNKRHGTAYALAASGCALSACGTALLTAALCCSRPRDGDNEDEDDDSGSPRLGPSHHPPSGPPPAAVHEDVPPYWGQAEPVMATCVQPPRSSDTDERAAPPPHPATALPNGQGRVELTGVPQWRQRFERVLAARSSGDEPRLQLHRVWRVDNSRLFAVYAAHRDNQPSTPTALAAPRTAVSLSPEWLVELQLRSVEANEVMLWHGTTPEHADMIVREGFDERARRPSGRFGAGVYFAEDPAKADSYTGDSSTTGSDKGLTVQLGHGGNHSLSYPYPPTQQQQPRTDALRHMFLSRVALGTVAEQAQPTPEARLPPPGSQSVVGCADGRYREFVTYDGWLAYPAYLVQYTRV